MKAELAAGGRIRARVALALAVLAVALAAAAAATAPSFAGPGPGAGPVPPGPGAPDLSRVISARMYQNGKLTALGETPQSLGDAIASLRPTYVAALLRFKASNRPTTEEIEAWNAVIAIVRQTSPGAKFAVELNGLQFPNITKLNTVMARIRQATHPDGWLFDFYSTAAAKNPNVMQAAVANAHGNGEFVGGNIFGITKNPPIPSGTDYIAVQDHNQQLNVRAMQQLAQKGHTVMFTLNNNPQHPDSDSCAWIQSMGTPARAAYLTKRAHQQQANDFRMGYPVFFPECERNRQNPKPQVFTYHAPSDVPMMTTIGNLLGQFE